MPPTWGISVANAVDVAREAADIVLLEKDLAVLEQGVKEGRTTFANTHKYIFMATSANFGNMFSHGGRVFVPALPADCCPSRFCSRTCSRTYLK